MGLMKLKREKGEGKIIKGEEEDEANWGREIPWVEGWSRNIEVISSKIYIKRF